MNQSLQGPSKNEKIIKLIILVIIVIAILIGLTLLTGNIKILFYGLIMAVIGFISSFSDSPYGTVGKHGKLIGGLFSTIGVITIIYAFLTEGWKFGLLMIPVAMVVAGISSGLGDMYIRHKSEKQK
jgi:multisubunit Na+/H+ antiporter MnhF subunit